MPSLGLSLLAVVAEVVEVAVVVVGTTSYPASQQNINDSVLCLTSSRELDHLGLFYPLTVHVSA